MLCKKLHHAASRCLDARETVDFYTQVLGLRFSHAMGEDHVPSTGKYSPHVHIFLEMEDGSAIAFFECPRDAGRTCHDPARMQGFADEAPRVLALWEKTHDWSQREALFGAKSGYARQGKESAT